MIKNRYLPAMTFAVVFLIIGVSAVYAQEVVNQPQAVDPIIRDDINKEEIHREELEVIAERHVNLGRLAFENDEYEKAVTEYLKAIEELKKCSRTSPRIKENVVKIQETIAVVYHFWAKEIGRQAEKSANAGEYTEAIKKCAEAIKMDPSTKTNMEDMIKRFEKMKKVVEYRNDTAEDLVDPNKENRLYKIDLFYSQAKKFYGDREWDKARDKFEEVLSLNPYHVKSIEKIREINKKMYKVGDWRLRTTERERMAEAEWKYVTPLLPRAEAGENEIASEPIARQEGGDVIKRKLREIVIDHIEFEEVTIPTVVKHLKTRSKELDPEKKGVNIFLRLGSGATEEAGADADLGDDDDDDEALFDDEEGDDDDDDDVDLGDDVDSAIGSTDVPTITIVVDDIPLGEAIRYICRGANLKYRIEKFAVVIASQDVPLDDLETRIYPVEQEAFSELGGDDAEEGGTSSVEGYFRRRGITFPENARVVYDNRISRLIATNTPDNLSKTEDIIRELNVVDPQVLIEAKFVEIQENDIESLGINWRVQRPVGQTTSSATFDVNDSIQRFTPDTTWAGADEMFNITHQDSTLVNWQAIVHALDINNVSDILSTPRITTQNGEEATIRMVTEEYFPESWGEATVIDDDYFVPSVPEFGEPTELGIRLTVTPTVDADRYTISLDMLPVIQSHVGWIDYSYTITVNDSPATNPVRMPIIEARTIETQFNVYDGETVVLGGVIRDTIGNTDDRIPALGDVPLLGRIFRSKNRTQVKSNLLIFTTVRLVNPDGSPLREREVRGKPPFRQ